MGIKLGERDAYRSGINILREINDGVRYVSSAIKVNLWNVDDEDT